MGIKIKKIIKGEQVSLKKTTPSFKKAQEMFQIVHQNRTHLLPWLDWVLDEITKGPQDTFKFFVASEEAWKAEKRFEYLIHLNKTNQIIGGVGVSHLDSVRSHKIEIGYWLDKNYCGKGLMQQAVRLVEQEFFNKGFLRIVIRNDTENKASIRTVEMLGYHFEGVARKEKYNKAFKEYRNMNIWSKLKEE